MVVMRPLILILLVTLLLIGAVFLGIKISNTNSPSPIPFANNREEAIDTWKKYEDSNAGFSLKYPQDVLLISKAAEVGETITGLRIVAQKINTMEEAPLNYGKTQAIEDEQELKGGGFGVDMDFAFAKSKKVVFLKGTYLKTYSVFSRFVEDDVTFERMAVFYNRGYQVRLILYGPKKLIIESEPEFFKDFPETGCTSADWECKAWNYDKLRDFYDKASAKGSSEAAKWYRTMDSILETLEIAR